MTATPGATFDEYGPDGAALTVSEVRTTWSGPLPASADFRVGVRQTYATTAAYTITIRIA